MSLGHFWNPNCSPLEGWVLVAKESNVFGKPFSKYKYSNNALEAFTAPHLFVGDSERICFFFLQRRLKDLY
jgi:hypothetical protein